MYIIYDLRRKDILIMLSKVFCILLVTTVNPAFMWLWLSSKAWVLLFISLLWNWPVIHFCSRLYCFGSTLVNHHIARQYPPVKFSRSKSHNDNNPVLNCYSLLTFHPSVQSSILRRLGWAKLLQNTRSAWMSLASVAPSLSKRPFQNR